MHEVLRPQVQGIDRDCREWWSQSVQQPYVMTTTMNRLVDQKGPEGEASVRLLVRMKTELAKAQLGHHALQPKGQSVASVASSHPPCKWDTVWDKVRDSCYHVHKSRSKLTSFFLWISHSSISSMWKTW